MFKKKIYVCVMGKERERERDDDIRPEGKMISKSQGYTICFNVTVLLNRPFN